MMRFYIIVPVSSLSYTLLNKTTSRLESHARKNVAGTHACLELLPTTDFSQLTYRIYSEVEVKELLAGAEWTAAEDAPPQMAMFTRIFKKIIS